MTAAWEIASATPDDYTDLAALQVASWQLAYRNEFDREFLEQRLPELVAARWARLPDEPDTIIRVARKIGATGRIGGFGLAYPGREAYLDNLHVRPKLRGQGIGEALLRAMAAALREAGSGSLSLTVFSSNRGARAFYARCGAQEAESFAQVVHGSDICCTKLVWSDLNELAGGA